MNVYSKVYGKLAKWEVSTSNIDQARRLVEREVGRNYPHAILAVVEPPKDPNKAEWPF